MEPSMSSSPSTLTWRNMNVFVDSRRTTRRRHAAALVKGEGQFGAEQQILRNVSGVAAPFHMTAIMGSSGAGKTTLLNALLGRNSRQLRIEGTIRLNGMPVDDYEQFSSCSAYVQQEDLFIATLTVREHLTFLAALRLDGRLYSMEESKKLVDELVSELELTSCQNTAIGTAGGRKGISGGERKRLSFASEMLTHPSILLCDEPTTGLDSHLAESVVRVLHKQANKGMAILCTIHQPSSQVYELFDTVLLLANGRVAFLGERTAAVEFFSTVGYHCPSDHNPADYFFDVLALRAGRDAARLERICDEYDASQHSTRLVERLNSIVVPRRRPSSPCLRHKAKASLQLSVLLFRSSLSNLREPGVFATRMVNKLVLGVFIGLLYLQADRHDETWAASINGLYFEICAELIFSAVFGVLYFLPADLPLVSREHHDGLYAVWTFYAARQLSFLLAFTLDGLLYMFLVYWAGGLNPAFGAFLVALLTALLAEQAAVSFGVAVGCLAPTPALAVTTVAPVMSLLSLTGGLFANVDALPAAVGWTQYLSMFRYSFEAFLINEWRGLKFANNGTGDELLEEFGFRSPSPWADLALLAFMTVLFYLLGYSAFLLRVKRTR